MKIKKYLILLTAMVAVVISLGACDSYDETPDTENQLTMDLSYPYPKSVPCTPEEITEINEKKAELSTPLNN